MKSMMLTPLKFSVSSPAATTISSIPSTHLVPNTHTTAANTPTGKNAVCSTTCHFVHPLQEPYYPFYRKELRKYFDVVQSFEALADSFGFSKIQKSIFVERALKGLASLFVRSQFGLTSYLMLKQTLINEFEQIASSARIHHLLIERSCRPQEKSFEYFLTMKEIAQRGNIDVISLIHYIINGIQN